MSNKLVSIVIVFGGSQDYIQPLLDSIKLQNYSPVEIAVIDNSAGLDFSQKIAESSPGVKIQTNPKNLFYCQALNIGIKMSKGDIILCLNDDVVLGKNFIETAVAGFHKDDKIGMVSGKILRIDKKRMDSTGLFLSLWRTARERGYGSQDKGQFEKEGYVFGVNGAVAFYRRIMLEEISVEGNYFDPDFHIFYEDLDIAWRAQNKGWRGYYIPGAVAYHARGGTVRKNPGTGKPLGRRYLNEELHADLIKNRYLAIIRNESLLGFFLHLPFIFLHDILMWAYVFIFKRKVVKIFLSQLDYLRYTLRKRAAVGK